MLASDTKVDVWNLTNNTIERQYSLRDTAQAAAISSDGYYIVVCSSSDIRAYSLRTGDTLWQRLLGHSTCTLCISVDDRHVILGLPDPRVTLLDLRTGESLHEWKGHKGEVTSVTITADGEYVISSSMDTTIRLWWTKDIKKNH